MSSTERPDGDPADGSTAAVTKEGPGGDDVTGGPALGVPDPEAPVPQDQQHPPTSGDGRDTVTPAMRIAADWSWRFLVVVGAFVVVGFVLVYTSEVSIPIAIALLLSALLNPVKRFLVRHGWGNTLAAAAVFLGGLLIVVGLFTVVIRSLVSGAADLVDQVGSGLDKIRDWLINGPLGLSQDQIDSAVKSVQNFFTENKDTLTSGALNTATTAGHVLTGLALALFTLFFFLRDGDKIWHWVLRFAPMRARRPLDGAATRAWVTLGGYTRATILVALVDATGIGIVIFLVGVPLALPLAALVFLASFVPVIGAVLSGSVAVLVALVAEGPVQALIVLAGVIAVQQLEGHVLQPVLMGRAVQVHPLAVVLAIALGVILAGITGALLAVPIAACLNSGIKYLNGERQPADRASMVKERPKAHT